MTRIELWQPAGTTHVPGKGDFPERFAAGAFDTTVGTLVPVNVLGRPVGQARVVAARVADDGSGVTLTVDYPAGDTT